ncbi:MAG: hypothetical protein U0Q03_06415 [Acidimicrobiales bacterium]
MSFAPPSPTNPEPGQGFPPAGGPTPSRSTLIPGTDAPSPLAGTPGAPTTSQFLGGLGPDGQQTPPASPFGQQQPLGPQQSFGQQPFGQQPFQQAPGMQYAPLAPAPRRRSGGGLLLALLIIGPVIGISVGVWAFLRAREASDQAEQILDDAQQTVDSILDDVQDDIDDSLDDVPPVSLPVTLPDTVVPGSVPVSVPVSLPTETVPPATVAPAISLFDPAGATAVMGTFDAAISGEPTRILTAAIYPEYAFVQAQDANAPTHVDEYDYRDGFVSDPTPVQLVGDGDLEAALFSITDVDWSFINRAVTEAPGLMPTVEEGVVTHILIERSVFTADFSVTVRVYVSGPRGGGYVEYTPTGELIQVMV